MDTENLLQNVRNFFLEQYKDLNKTNSFLAFEPIGCVINPDDYTDTTTGITNEAKANEDIAEIVDRVPEISDVYIPGLDKISSHYEIVIKSAHFNAAAIDTDDKSDYMALLGKIKSDAEKLLEDADKLSVTNSGGKFFPATTIPARWYVKDSPIWSNKEFHLKDEVPNNQPEAAKPIDSKMRFLWKNIAVEKIDTVKVSETNPVFDKLLKTDLVFNIAAKKEAPRFQTLVQKPLMAKFNLAGRFADLSTPTEAARATAVTIPAVVSSRALLHFDPAIAASISEKTALNRQLLTNDTIDTSQPVSSTELSISFDYSIVQINRFWFDKKIFDFAKIWYTLAQPENFFSDGQRTPDNRGCLRAVPKAFIIVKNVKIKAAWSGADREAANGSVGFGCFNLVNSRFNENNELVNDALQIIGWLCEVLPKTPVTNDPFIKF